MKRRENESFEAYKKRRALENQNLKRKLRGTMACAAGDTSTRLTFTNYESAIANLQADVLSGRAVNNDTVTITDADGGQFTLVNQNSSVDGTYIRPENRGK